ncbi:hypothetical protein LZ31DRAFT_281134 [Colletotrichum somersetense]|nr:hypothetical protein LZ31DRAFT_281134 [Colletotrichum somersetense]
MDICHVSIRTYTTCPRSIGHYLHRVRLGSALSIYLTCRLQWPLRGHRHGHYCLAQMPCSITVQPPTYLPNNQPSPAQPSPAHAQSSAVPPSLEGRWKRQRQKDTASRRAAVGTAARSRPERDRLFIEIVDKHAVCAASICPSCARGVRCRLSLWRCHQAPAKTTLPSLSSLSVRIAQACL